MRLVPIKRSPVNHAPCRPLRDPHRDMIDGRGLSDRDAHVDTTCGWSVSLTGFDVASALPQRDARQYDCALFELATRRRITRLARRRTENNYHSPRYPAVDSYMVDITARPLAVIGAESFALPSEPKGGHMPDFEFGLREWIALEVLTPVFLLLLVAAAMFIQW